MNRPFNLSKELLLFFAGAAALILFGVVGLIAPANAFVRMCQRFGIILMLFLFGPVLLLAASIYYAQSTSGKIVLGC